MPKFEIEVSDTNCLVLLSLAAVLDVPVETFLSTIVKHSMRNLIGGVSETEFKKTIQDKLATTAPDSVREFLKSLEV